ncbi:MAG: SURF1 family protein [Paracoccaceae bacterium]|nr:SURF1 family protein [Paracoccaceae bacterium]
MRRLIFPLVFGLGGGAVLVALGLWQVDRLGQKRALVSAIEAQIAAAPGPLPEVPDAEDHRYLPVAVEGRFGEGEILVLSGRKGVGAGYRVIAPFETAKGRRILVDRGFLPEAAKAAPRPGGAARIEGNLDWPREADSFTPAPDRAQGLWFARDVASMAAALATEPVLLVLRDSSQTGLPLTPQPVDSAGIPNDHLEYAVTWFALALVWLGMTAYLLRRRARPTG